MKKNKKMKSALTKITKILIITSITLTTKSQVKFSLSETKKTDSGVTQDQPKKKEKTKQVGICYNLINSFMPNFEVTTQKKAYEKNLITILNEKINDFKTIQKLDPLKLEMVTEIYGMERYETSRQLLRWMAFGTKNIFSANTEIGTYKKKNQKMVELVPDLAENINKICRAILTDGFFNVYGLNSKKLQNAVNDAIMKLSKTLNSGELSAEEKEWIENMKKSSCEKNLNMLRKDFITNLLLTTKEESKTWFKNDFDLTKIKGKSTVSNKILELELMRKAFCGTVLAYFNEMLNPGSRTTRVFLDLFKYNLYYQIRIKFFGVNDKRKLLTIKKETVDYFLDKIVSEVYDSYEKKFKEIFKKGSILSQDNNFKNKVVIESILKIERDIHFQVDILITRWKDRFKKLVENYFEIQIKKTSNDQELFQTYFNTVIKEKIQSEHFLVNFYIDMAKQSIWELEGDRSIQLLEDQSSFLYIYLHHNYEVIKDIPLSHSEKFIPKLLSNYYTLRKKFIFIEYEAMDFSMKRDTGDIFSKIVRDSMTVKLIKNKRNKLYFHYCKIIRKERIPNSLPSEEEFCKGTLSVMENSIISGVEPLSLVAYGYAELFYKGYAMVRDEFVADLKKPEKKKEILEKMQRIMSGMSVAKITGSAYVIPIFSNLMKSSRDYYNIMLATFLFFDGDEMTVSMFHFKAMKFCEIVMNPVYGLKLFGRYFKHHETLGVIERYKKDLVKKYTVN